MSQSHTETFPPGPGQQPSHIATFATPNVSKLVHHSPFKYVTSSILRKRKPADSNRASIPSAIKIPGKTTHKNNRTNMLSQTTHRHQPPAPVRERLNKARSLRHAFPSRRTPRFENENRYAKQVPVCARTRTTKQWKVTSVFVVVRAFLRVARSPIRPIWISSDRYVEREPGGIPRLFCDVDTENTHRTITTGSDPTPSDKGELSSTFSAASGPPE